MFFILSSFSFIVFGFEENERFDLHLVIVLPRGWTYNQKADKMTQEIV